MPRESDCTSPVAKQDIPSLPSTHQKGGLVINPVSEQQPEGTTAYNAGAGEPTEPHGSSAGVDLERCSTTISASAAKEPEMPDHAEGDNLQKRLSMTGWEGAVIRSKDHPSPNISQKP